MDYFVIAGLFALQFGVPLGALALADKYKWSEPVTALLAVTGMVGAFCVLVYV